MSEFVPFLQTLAWIGFIVYAARKFAAQITSLIVAVEVRIRSGSSLKIGPVELGQDLEALEKLPSASEGSEDAERFSSLRTDFKSISTNTSKLSEDQKVVEDGEFSKERDGIYESNQGLFLTHVIAPSNEQGQKYDIYIYLLRHKSKLFDDIEYADFFLGKYWQNRIFRETVKDGLIGISTAAYGPFLCTCTVKMQDGTEVKLHRYVDFEMGRAFATTANNQIKKEQG